MMPFLSGIYAAGVISGLLFLAAIAGQSIPDAHRSKVSLVLYVVVIFLLARLAIFSGILAAWSISTVSGYVPERIADDPLATVLVFGVSGSFVVGCWLSDWLRGMYGPLSLVATVATAGAVTVAFGG